MRNLSKTDAYAAELYEQLQKAETDEEKQKAKEVAQEYVRSLQETANDSTPVVETKEEIVETEDTPVADEPETEDVVVDTVPDSEIDVPEIPQTDEEKIKQDLSQLAFNPRLAKCGITREEELFLQGVRVRKLSHQEKIELRRSIYQKKTQRNNQLQAEFRARRLEQKQKDLNDPEKIKYHQERKYVLAIVDALQNHKNMIYIFTQIDGLTPEIVRDLLQKPSNCNAFEQANPKFIENFYKLYGK